MRRRRVVDLRCDGVNSVEFARALREYEVNCVLVGSWGEILSPVLLRQPDVLFVNCHPSLLPAHRGANPYASVVREGESVTGVTFHLIERAVDAGPLLLQREVPVCDTDTGGDLRARCAETARELIPALIGIVKSPQSITPRDQAVIGAASYFPPVRREDGQIEWRCSAGEIHACVRGLRPWVESYTWLDTAIGKLRMTVKLLETEEGVGKVGAPGAILSCDRTGMRIACGQGSVLRVRDPQVKAGWLSLPAWLVHWLCRNQLRQQDLPPVCETGTGNHS